MQVLPDVGERLRVGVHVLVVDLLDDLEVGHHRPELRRRAQLELAALADVEGTVDVVGLDAQDVGVADPFPEREAVDDLLRVALGEEAVIHEAVVFGEVDVLQLGEDGGDLLLRVVVDRRGDLQVETVERVEAVEAEIIQEVDAHGVGRLALDERQALGLEDDVVVPKAQVDVLHGGLELRGDDVRLDEEVQVLVDQRLQRVAVLLQIVGRTALREEEAQDLFEGERFGLERLRIGDGAAEVGEEVIHLREVRAVPGDEAVADAADLAGAGDGAERDGVDVVRDDAAARGHRVAAVLVSAQRRRDHLDQLLLRRRGAAFGRVPVLLDLRGERRAAGALVTRQETRDDVVGDGVEEPAPLEGRILVGIALVEQVAVLDRQQRLHDGVGDRLEGLVDQLRVKSVEERLARGVEHRQAGLRLLAVDRVDQPGLHELEMQRRQPRLGDELVAALGDALEDVGDQRIAETLVVGTVLGKGDRLARPFRHVVSQVLRFGGEVLRLQLAGVELPVDEDAGRRQDRQERRDQRALHFARDARQPSRPRRDSVSSSSTFLALASRFASAPPSPPPGASLSAAGTSPARPGATPAAGADAPSGGVDTEPPPPRFSCRRRCRHCAASRCRRR